MSTRYDHELLSELPLNILKNPNSRIMGKVNIFSAILYFIFFILAGNKDSHKILHKCEICTDPNSDCRVSCPWVFEQLKFSIFYTLTPSFLIRSYHSLQYKNLHNISHNQINDCTSAKHVHEKYTPLIPTII